MVNALGVVGTGLRLGLCGLAVQRSRQLEVWGDGKTGAALLARLQVEGVTAVVLPAELATSLPAVPDTGLGLGEQLDQVTTQLHQLNTDKWRLYNSGVEAAVGGLINLPATLAGYRDQAVKLVTESMD